MTESIHPEVKAESAKFSWDRYIEENGIPEAAVLEITDYCDAGDCAHCYMKAIKYTTHETTGTFMEEKMAEIWGKVLAGNEKGKPEQIWVTGGEPTLNPKLGVILEKIKENGFYTNLVTNGESFAKEGYLKEVLSSGNLDEVLVTVRGMDELHDLLMLPADHDVWEKVPLENSSKGQIDTAKKTLGVRSRFERTMKGIVNLSQYENLKVSLNIDINAGEELEDIVEKIKEAGGRVDNICLQVQQNAGRAEGSEVIPNEWRRPTVESVGSYIAQAKKLIYSGMIKNAEIIDPIPQEIVDSLGLEGEEIYRPEATPAISARGKLRENVVG